MTVGFFGKVRSHGDFISRRLPPEMLVPFDAWIQAWLVQSKRELGADWLAIWSTSPLWRFVLAPNVCGPQAWTGVMMPSADRVGRCFPLILAASLEAAPALRDCLSRHAAWYARLEALMLASLDDGFTIEAFDALLLVVDDAPLPAAGGGGAPIAALAVVTLLPGASVSWLVDAGLDTCSAWWTDGSEEVAPCLAVCVGLPSAKGTTAMLDGRWLERGWCLL